MFILTLADQSTQRVTYNQIDERALDWSCSNRMLAIEVGPGDKPGEINIYVADPDLVYRREPGIEITTGTADRTRFPAWSCDGKRIAYHASPDREEDAEIFVIYSDGKNRVRLTDNDYNDFGPAWSPDGKYMLFQAYGRDNNSDLYLMAIDTQRVMYRLSQTRSVAESYAVWQPTGACR